MHTLQRLLVLPVLLCTASCAHRASSEQPAGARSVLHVENHHWLDVNIVVEHQGQRSRLGTISATSTRDFVFPRRLLGGMADVRLIADPVGEPGGIVTDVIVLRPGTRVTWTLESSLRRSSLAVY